MALARLAGTLIESSVRLSVNAGGDDDDGDG